MINNSKVTISHQLEDTEISLLTDDMINYDALADELLAKLTVGDDLFVATSALYTLSKRRSPLTWDLAYSILKNKHGDRYLQAGALDGLFPIDSVKVQEIIAGEIRICDPYLFEEVLELILENQDDFKSAESWKILDVASIRIHEINQDGHWPNFETFVKSME